MQSHIACNNEVSVTFRFLGDALNPEAITARLTLNPTMAHARGSLYPNILSGSTLRATGDSRVHSLPPARLMSTYGICWKDWHHGTRPSRKSSTVGAR